MIITNNINVNRRQKIMKRIEGNKQKEGKRNLKVTGD
jgi:hypothetical protein